MDAEYKTLSVDIQDYPIRKYQHVRCIDKEMSTWSAASNDKVSADMLNPKIRQAYI